MSGSFLLCQPPAPSVLYSRLNNSPAFIERVESVLPSLAYNLEDGKYVFAPLLAEESLELMSLISRVSTLANMLL